MRPWRKGKPHPFARGGLFATGEGFLHATQRQHTIRLVVDFFLSYMVGAFIGLFFVIITSLLQMPRESLLPLLFAGVPIGGAIYGAICVLGRPIGCLVTKTSLRELRSGAPIGVWALTWRMALLAPFWFFVVMAWMTVLRGDEELPFGQRFTRHVLVDLRR